MFCVMFFCVNCCMIIALVNMLKLPVIKDSCEAVAAEPGKEVNSSRNFTNEAEYFEYD